MTALLEARDVTRVRGRRTVLSGVSLAVEAGQILGLTGPSGSGKSTLARILLGLDTQSSGDVLFRGANLATLSSTARRAIRPRIQAVFQDTVGAFNPRWRAGRIVAEPLAASGVARAEWPARVAAGLAEAGLGEEIATRWPHELSGGQRQRLAIARALVTRPDLVIADEPVSALDVSVQAQVLNLFMSLRAQGVAFLFISHDLPVIRHISDRVFLLKDGVADELAV